MAVLAEPLYTFNKSSERVLEFKGFNVKGDIDDGEMRDMENLCADEYPSLYQRGLRGTYLDLSEGEAEGSTKYATTMMVKSHFNGSQEKKLAWIDSDGHFFYDGVDYYDPDRLALAKDTQMVAINTKICFFPEKKYFKLRLSDDESEADRIGDLDAEFRLVGDSTINVGNNDLLNFVSCKITFPEDVGIASMFNEGDAVSVYFNSLTNYSWTNYEERVMGEDEDDNRRLYGCIYHANITVDAANIDAGVSFGDDIYVLPVIQGDDEDEATYRSRVEGIISQVLSQSDFEASKDTLGFTKVVGADGESILFAVTSTKYERATGITLYDSAGEQIKISGTSDLGFTWELDYLTMDLPARQLHAENTTFDADAIVDVSAIIVAMDDNSITFPDNTFSNAVGEQITGQNIRIKSISISRPCPDLDYVIENNNRLWGVSNADNTIYACKLGDPTNWQYYQSTSLDSYYAEQGSDGEWTGVGQYGSHLLFFKEDCVHKVYGSFPSEYQISTVQCNGIEKGSDRSVAYLNGVLMYKSRVGIMAYDGGLPVNMSHNFGKIKYRNAVAGTDGSKYYVSMENVQTGEHELMVYDSDYMLWHKQDNVHATSMVCLDGHVMFACYEDPVIYIADADVPTESSDITWRAQLGPYDEYLENKKVHSRMRMRYKMPEGSSFTVSVSIDEGDWQEVQTVTSSEDRVQELFIIPQRCDNFAIRIEGTGFCKIKSMVREFRQSTAKKEV